MKRQNPAEKGVTLQQLVRTQRREKNCNCNRNSHGFAGRTTPILTIHLLIPQELGGGSGPEPQKSPKESERGGGPPAPGAPESPKSAPRSPKGVQKESEAAFLDSFQTPWRILWGVCGSEAPGHPFGLFSDSFGVPGPKGPGERTVPYIQGSGVPTKIREAHSMDQYRSRPKLSQNFEGHWSIPFPGETRMDQWS